MTIGSKTTKLKNGNKKFDMEGMNCVVCFNKECRCNPHIGIITKKGRFSCKTPNIQSIPREDILKTKKQNKDKQ